MAKKWTDEEIQFLKIFYPDKNIKAVDIAKELGRTENQIFKKAGELKIRKNKEELPIGCKRCPRCKTILTLECFYLNNSWCKQCATEYRKSLRHKEVKKDISPQLAVKKCARCEEIKSVELFGKVSRNKDGYNETCLECRRKIVAESRNKLLKERGW